MTQKTVYHNS